MRSTSPRQKSSERYYASASFESRFPRCVVVGVADFRSKPEVGIFCDALDFLGISFQKKVVLMEYSRKWPPEPSQIPRKRVLERKEGWNRESYTESTHTSNSNFDQNKVSFRDDYLRGHLSAGVPGRS